MRTTSTCLVEVWAAATWCCRGCWDPHEQAGRTPAGVLVGPGAGDNAGAALGLGAGPGDVGISIGTSGTVFAISDVQPNDLSGLVAGFADASGRFLPIITTLNAARILVSTAALLGVDLDALAELALQAQPGSGGLVLVPYFEGERTPNLPQSRASLHGMTIASATRENLARAAHEALLASLGAGLDAIRAGGRERAPAAADRRRRAGPRGPGDRRTGVQRAGGRARAR